MWQDTIETKTLKLNHLEAKVYCRKLRLASRYDWRVPTYYELSQLLDYSKSDPSIKNGIKNISSTNYRSSSQDVNDKNRYWYIDFKNGYTDTISKMKKQNIRCIRDISNEKGNY